MSGYSVTVKCKLMVDSTDPKAMADVSDILAKLPSGLRQVGFTDIEVSPKYHDRLTASNVPPTVLKAAD